MATHGFWIPVSFGSEDTLENFKNALSACHSVHTYTLQALNDYFISHAEPYPYVNFRIELMLFLSKNRMQLPAQRYSLIRASEKTFPYFTENKKIKKGKFVPVDPIERENYCEMQIESRHIWRKYLALNGLITTGYGSIFLTDDWTDILSEQAAEKGIAFDTVPYLWHSILLHFEEGRNEIRFNLHEPDSVFGKMARKEMRKDGV